VQLLFISAMEPRAYLDAHRVLWWPRIFTVEWVLFYPIVQISP
jgi:hypothetical protein